MKRLTRSLLLTVSTAALLATSSIAQLPGASTSSSTTGGAAAGAAKQLGAADKKFIKDAGEQVLAVTHLVEITRGTGPGGDPLKKLSAKIKADFDKIWGELGTVAQARNVELPKTEASANEKALITKLRKTEADKFDKTFLKVLDKETKKAAQVFQAADKSVQDAELKTVVTNWASKVKDYADQVAAAEDEASKRK